MEFKAFIKRASRLVKEGKEMTVENSKGDVIYRSFNERNNNLPIPDGSVYSVMVFHGLIDHLLCETQDPNKVVKLINLTKGS